MKCTTRGACRRVSNGDKLLVGTTLAFFAYLAYEFTLFPDDWNGSARPQQIDLGEGLLIAVLFCVGLLYLSWRYYWLQYRAVLRRRRSEHRASSAAERDWLTALPNRRRFLRAIADAVAPGLSPAAIHAVLLLNLKGLRHINDVFGHSTGDEVLVRAAGRLRRECPDAMLARMGDHEFGLLVTDLSSAEQAASTALRLAGALRRPMCVSEARHEFDVRIGIALIPQDGRGQDDILRKAALALERAKSAPGSDLRFFEPEMDARIREHTQLEHDLRAAIATDAVRPFYQPIVDLASQRIIGFEALARWTHPQLGPVAPDRFIAVAERCGMMDALSEHLLRHAVRDALAWPGHLRLSFNISPSQLGSETWPRRVLEVLQETGIDPRRIDLEVTETALFDNLNRARETLNILRGGGLRIALDDFGTGASSLHHLRELRVDMIKIDRKFVADLVQPDASALVRGVIGLAHGLGLAVIAEGVERDEQAAELRALHCDQAQGYLYGAAMAASKAAALALNERSGVSID